MGYYCDNSTTNAFQFPCPPGYYRNDTMGQTLDDCFPCPGGYYCQGDGNAMPTAECDPGYFCIRAAFDPNPQDYNDYMVGDCLCPDNFTGGQCQPGYYCPGGSHGQ